MGGPFNSLKNWLGVYPHHIREAPWYNIEIDNILSFIYCAVKIDADAMKKTKLISWKALVLEACQKCTVLEVWPKILINCPKFVKVNLKLFNCVISVQCRQYYTEFYAVI